jgi:hypothetical protein
LKADNRMPAPIAASPHPLITDARLTGGPPESATLKDAIPANGLVRAHSIHGRMLSAAVRFEC